MKHSIRLVTIWSGALPDYLPLFLLTAGHNHTVDFVFVADSPSPLYLLEGGLPSNVTWVEWSHNRLISEIESGLGLTLEKVTPYKLCDFKPTFGRTLAELLEGADFWGHVDCDMVLGDLRSFLTEEVLDSYDVAGLRGRRFVHGPLTVYRNTESVNALYTTAEGWKETLSASRMYSFTETCGWWAWQKQTRPEGTPESFTDAVLREADAGRARFYDADHIEEGDPRTKPLTMRWTDSALYDDVKERPLAYYHFVNAKKAPFFRIPKWRALPHSFTITRLGIQSVEESGSAFHTDRLWNGIPVFSRARWKRAKRAIGRIFKPTDR